MPANANDAVTILAVVGKAERRAHARRAGRNRDADRVRGGAGRCDVEFSRERHHLTRHRLQGRRQISANREGRQNPRQNNPAAPNWQPRTCRTHRYAPRFENRPLTLGNG